MDILTAATQILDAARARGIMLATAESCTGGLIFGALTEIAGSSDVMDRGFVTYSNHAKEQMLGVPTGMIARDGAVSETVARAMAEGALARSDAAIAVSVTGVAGPGGTPAKPEGMVCFGLAQSGKPTQTETVQFGPLGRSVVREHTVSYALNMLVQALT